MANFERSVWGWGYEGGVAKVPQVLVRAVLGVLATKLPKPTARITQPTKERLGEVARGLRKPRFAKDDVPARVAEVLSDDPLERMRHSFGKSFDDICRGALLQYTNPPDYVAFPRDEEDIVAILNYCTRTGTHCIPFGGGSSVVGGIEPVADAKRGVITVDLTRHLNRLLSIDAENMTARVQAGAFGPQFTDQLKRASGGKFTFRHFPQSFEFSTVGGWVVTRSGGHFATNHTHIDSFVVSLRIATAAGVFETRDFPSSGAGPTPDRIFLGSEGILGIVTEVVLRVHKQPKHRAACTVVFPSFEAGVAAARAIAQSGLYPAQARLMDDSEIVMLSGMQPKDKQLTSLLLGFESADVSDLDSRYLEPAVQLCAAHGGQVEGRAAGASPSGATDTFRSNFTSVPYLRDVLLMQGVIVETFETACTWSAFPKLHARMLQIARDNGALISCRFTHLYTDGPAPYYTVAASSTGTDGESMLAQWRKLKKLFSDGLAETGGTITHHHAVGKDHQPWYAREKGKEWVNLLKGIKGILDPAAVLNPGTILDAEAKVLKPKL
ncbi:FAD linked oxidase domain-containing protein [Hyaloraphidium curvatum]|nr:FAD linked oxidase domain-containing protein [Hyaloraphidium curvatum]